MAPLPPVPRLARRPSARRLRLLLIPVPTLLAIAAMGSEPASVPGTSLLAIVERSIVQDQGGWQVDYRLRNEGPTAIVGGPEEIQARLEGWVSNSRVARHAVPRLSTLVVA